MKILIVDDEPYNVLLLKELLESKYQVLTARNGVEALEQARFDRPDLILLDIIMPGMDGYEVLKVLKEDPETKNIHVIMVTAKEEKEDVKKAFVNGASDYVKKPIDLTELLYKIGLYEELVSKQQVIDEYKEYVEMYEGILYAQHIQRTLLPDKNQFECIFPKSFCLYMPKSFISGDFYFASKLNGKTFLSLFDCTGHGIPAGMSSVIGFMILEKLVNQQRYSDPAQVAMMLKSELLSLLSRTSDVYSKNLFSMDAIFCEMNEAMQLKFVGARRPLVIIRRGDNPLIVDNQIVKSIKQKDETHLYYLKGCKHSIDIEAKAYSFYCKNIQLENDDKIYLFSDGYSDQMGGRNKKKYGRKALMNYILNNQDIDMKNEKHQLYENFIEFQGEDEQTDDVVVLGINACQDQIQ